MSKKKPETAAAGQSAALRLHYALVGDQVTVTAHTGAANSEFTDADIQKQIVFAASQFPASFTTGSDDVTKSLAGYGLQKLLQDRTSQVSGDVLAKVNAMEKEANRLIESGQWSERKESAERTPRAKVDNFVARAIAELKGISVAEAEASLKAVDKEKRDAVAANPKVVELVARYKAEAKDVAAADLSDLLA